MAAEMVEMVMLNEVVDTSIDEELLLDYDDDGEIHLLAAIGAFMRRDLNRIVGFYKIVVPSYSVDEFQSHFRMTKNTFELAATGAIPTGNRFGRKPIPLQKQTLAFLWYTSNMEVIRSVSDRFNASLSSLHAYGSKLAQGLELVDKSKWNNTFSVRIFRLGILDYL